MGGVPGQVCTVFHQAPPMSLCSKARRRLPTATLVPGMPPQHPTVLRRLSLPALVVTADRRFDSSYRPIAVGR